MALRADQKVLQCTLDRWSGGRAVFRLADGQELIVARRYLPKEIREGDVLELQFLTGETATRRREDLARAILKEILRG